MKYVSTQDKTSKISFSEALVSGLASDGGLYVPDTFPSINLRDFDGLESILEIAKKFLSYFIDGDVLEDKLDSICSKAFNFDIPLHSLDNNTSILELFHGPTGAFKDVGARFLAQCLEHLDKKLSILVATSGDTGSAVASAFYKLKNVKVGILFPKGKISEFQEAQLTCWDTNIIAFRVKADFDSCQRMVKEVFKSDQFNEFHFSSANSINIGRLLPQCVYYVAASLWYFRRAKVSPNFIIPTGNMGNSMAAIWVKHMGFPINRIIMSCNTNDVIPKFISNMKFVPKPSIQTLANAMDVGNPSNMERFIDLLKNENANIPNLQIEALSVNDEEIKNAIITAYSDWNQVLCPHTATAAYIQQEKTIPHAIIVATAHPSKFKDIIEPIVTQQIEIPIRLNLMLRQPKTFIEINPSLDELRSHLGNLI